MRCYSSDFPDDCFERREKIWINCKEIRIDVAENSDIAFCSLIVEPPKKSECGFDEIFSKRLSMRLIAGDVCILPSGCLIFEEQQ